MKGNILIVDDEASIRDIVRKSLERHDYECGTADSAATAIETIRENDYDIVITDKNLPGTEHPDEGGYDVIAFIRDNTPWCATIVMTGFASVESAVQSMKLGAFDYISKPFDFDIMIKKVDRIREYQNFLNPEVIFDIYKTLHSQILDLFEQCESDDMETRHRILGEVNENFDCIFSTMKSWEKVIFSQRDRLANIALMAEQLRDTIAEGESASQLIEKILREAGQRL